MFFRIDSLDDFKFRRAEIDEQSVFDAGRAQVVDQLRDVDWGELVAVLQLDDEAVPDDEVGLVSADDEAVLVRDGERDLGFDKDAFLLKSVLEGVLVDLLEIPCSEIEVQCVGRLPDRGDKFLNRNLVSGGSAVLRECCGDLLVAHAGESVSLTLHAGMIP